MPRTSSLISAEFSVLVCYLAENALIMSEMLESDGNNSRSDGSAQKLESAVAGAQLSDDTMRADENEPCRTNQSSLSGEWSNIWLLLALYTLQGIPIGLAVSVPMYMQSRGASFRDFGTFSLASYPYSLKLLWAPLVDALYTDRFRLGQRKSWILPTQLLAGVIMLILGARIDNMFGGVPPEADTGGAPAVGATIDVAGLTASFFVLYFLVATQDIAVDGWALTMLRPENVGYASTCNTVGQTAGVMLAYGVLMALDSADFANSYVRGPLGWPHAPTGLVSMAGFMSFWGVAFIVFTLALWALKREAPVAVPSSSISASAPAAGAHFSHHSAEASAAGIGEAPVLAIAPTAGAAGSPSWASAGPAAVTVSTGGTTAMSAAAVAVAAAAGRSAAVSPATVSVRTIAGRTRSRSRGRTRAVAAAAAADGSVGPSDGSHASAAAAAAPLAATDVASAASATGSRSRRRNGSASPSASAAARRAAHASAASVSATATVSSGATPTASAAAVVSGEARRKSRSSDAGNSHSATMPAASASASAASFASAPCSSDDAEAAEDSESAPLRGRQSGQSTGDRHGTSHSSASAPPLPAATAGKSSQETALSLARTSDAAGVAQPAPLSAWASVTAAYRDLWAVIRLRHVLTLAVVMLTCKAGFAATDNATSLVMQGRGVTKQEIALLDVISTPLQLAAQVAISRFTSGPRPMSLFMQAFPVRIAIGMLWLALIYGVLAASAPSTSTSSTGTASSTPPSAPASGVSLPVLALIFLLSNAHSLVTGVMFIAQISFFTQVSDPALGGSYMTLLNTVANLGSKWPQYLTFRAIDALNQRACVMMMPTDGADSGSGGGGGSCGSDAEKATCTAAGGSCVTVRDGYAIMVVIGSVAALLWLALMRRRVAHLETVPRAEWLLVK